MFQKRHYDAIADAIADATLTDYANPRDQIQITLANMFAKDNPRFNRDRFYRACKWQPNRLAAE